jgi:hypothetical protein
MLVRIIFPERIKRVNGVNPVIPLGKRQYFGRRPVECPVNGQGEDTIA